ncbi:MAG TPA: hypothetical protein VNQ74_16620, partial [Burkholderiaceae bacterium]|nr:hypothetical protein [Burkholderiaceae bacterium]
TGSGWDSTTARRAPGLGRADEGWGAWGARATGVSGTTAEGGRSGCGGSRAGSNGIDVRTVAGLVGAFGSGISEAIE